MVGTAKDSDLCPSTWWVDVGSDPFWAVGMRSDASSAVQVGPRVQWLSPGIHAQHEFENCAKTEIAGDKIYMWEGHLWYE